MTKKNGRPSKYDKKIADELTERLADGQSLRTICADSHMPHKSTVFRWLAFKDREDFRDQYAYARESQADTLADEIINIADDCSDDITFDKSGDPKIDGGAINRARIRIDARKWYASKLKPRAYGDKLDLQANVDHSVTVELVNFNERPAE